jgi:hypothetical protein
MYTILGVLQLAAGILFIIAPYKAGPPPAWSCTASVGRALLSSPRAGAGSAVPRWLTQFAALPCRDAQSHFGPQGKPSPASMVCRMLPASIAVVSLPPLALPCPPLCR